jgi:hypothetical protein
VGEAIETVKGSGRSSPVPRSQTFAKGSVLSDLSNVVDRIDRAKEVKQTDLDAEGRAALAENHAKLGLLQAAGALVRRAKALLEDYGEDLDEDISAELNEGLGDDLKRQFTDQDEVKHAPFGPDDHPDWLKVGLELRDPDGDGPWKVRGINYMTGTVLIEDQRKNQDGTPFKDGMPQDSITFDELGPDEDEWHPLQGGE